MKKLTFAMLMLAVAGLTTMVSCRKPVNEINVPGEGKMVTFNAITESGSKVAVVNKNILWKDGDKIKANGEEMTLVEGEGTVNGTFRGRISTEAPYLIGFPAEYTNYEAASKGDATLSLQLPASYTYDADHVVIPMAARNSSVDGEISFSNAVNVLKLTLTGDGTDASKLTSIVLTCESGNICGNIPVTFSDGVTFNYPTGDGMNTMTVNINDDIAQLGTTAKDFYIPVPKIAEPSSKDKIGFKICFNCANNEKVEKTVNYNADFNQVNQVLTASLNVVAIPVGVLSGVFSVSSTKTVKFSKGNLQYQANTEKWRLAENQYDYVGNADYGNVKVGSTKCNNANISSSYTGWIDLFGWGCTGHKDTRSEDYTNWYQTRYMPWDKENSTVSGTYNQFGYGPDYFSNQPYNLTVANKSDWGCNTIYAGSTATTGWRTLTKEEWTYLLNDRTQTNRYAKAMVNSVKGLIIFPDGYNGSTTVTGITGISAVNTSSASVPTTSIPSDTWTAMENAGVVFLPSTGYRYYFEGVSLGGMGTDCNCYYWSSSCISSYNAYYLKVVNSSVDPQAKNGRYYGYSVRLVK